MKQEEINKHIEKQNELMGRENFPKTRKMVSPDGTIAYIWDGKLHNWEGAARIPQGNNRLREYYIYGIQKTEEEWKEAKRDGNGLPWYKNPAYKERS
jgi:hypothetical protein